MKKKCEVVVLSNGNRARRRVAENSRRGDWRAPRFCDVMNGEPVPANWFHRVGIGIRRPTCSREGTLRGAFAACGHRSPVLAALTDHVHGWRCPSVEWLLAPLE